MAWTRIAIPGIVCVPRVYIHYRCLCAHGRARCGRYRRHRARHRHPAEKYDPSTSINGGLPQIQFCSSSFQAQYCGTNYSQIGANSWLPSKEYSNVWDFIQNVSITKGTHALKFGAEFRTIKFPFFQVPYPHGELYFGPQETAYPTSTLGGSGQTGDAMASFLLGNLNC